MIIAPHTNSCEFASYFTHYIPIIHKNSKFIHIPICVKQGHEFLFPNHKHIIYDEVHPELSGWQELPTTNIPKGWNFHANSYKINKNDKVINPYEEKPICIDTTPILNSIDNGLKGNLKGYNKRIPDVVICPRYIPNKPLKNLPIKVWQDIIDNNPIEAIIGVIGLSGDIYPLVNHLNNRYAQGGRYTISDSVMESYYWLRRAKIVVTQDSGTGHYASFAQSNQIIISNAKIPVGYLRHYEQNKNLIAIKVI
jgi:hypothetical protein